MRKYFTQSGMTVVEAVVAIGVFSLIVGIGYQLYITSNRLIVRADTKAQALALAEEGLEAARSIRDTSYASLTLGTSGIAQSGNKWNLSGSSDTTGIFTRTLLIGLVSADEKSVRSTVSWNERGTALSVVLNTSLTNWRKISSSMSAGLTVISSTANLSLLSSLRLLTGIGLSSTGTPSTITITSIQTSWTKSSRTLQQIRSPNGTAIMTGSYASGTNVTLTTPITMTGVGTRGLEFYFNASMNGNNTITVILTFSDGTTQTFTITNPPTGV